MTTPQLLLVDNGSKRAAATLALRHIAAALSAAAGVDVHAVSLNHADCVPADQLGGRSADVFGAFLRRQLELGQREFVVVPLFFGPSRALSSFIPEQVESLRDQFGDIRVDVADVLVPLPVDEPRIVDILEAHLGGRDALPKHSHVVVVDHGSPSAAVNAVRRHVVDGLRRRLPDDVVLDQAVMERREGASYDFNGELLADALERLAGEHGSVDVAIAMMFLLPGRHAGQGGDIAEICSTAMASHPGLRVRVSPLIGEHPLLIEILHDRLRSMRAL